MSWVRDELASVKLDATSKSILISRYIGLFLAIGLVGYIILGLVMKLYVPVAILFIFCAYYFFYFLHGQKIFPFWRGAFIIQSNLLVVAMGFFMGRETGVQYFFFSCFAGCIILLSPFEKGKILASMLLTSICFFTLEISNYTFPGIQHPPEATQLFLRDFVICGPMFLMLFECALLYWVHFHVEFAYRTTIGQLKEQRVLEQKLEQVQLEVIAANRLAALGQMAGNIAHEMNNPLFIISGFAKKLRKQMADGTLLPITLSDGLERIDRTCMRMSKTISGMLKVARQSQPDSYQDVSLSQIVNDTLSSCEAFLRNKGVSLFVDIADHITVRCAPSEIGQVLLNLISNAADAVESVEKKWIRVAARESALSVTITVTDSGPGIAPELREKIMAPFFTTKAAGKGTGLGLSISKTILEAQGGTLSLNTSSAFTQFVIQLPSREVLNARTENPVATG